MKRSMTTDSVTNENQISAPRAQTSLVRVHGPWGNLKYGATVFSKTAWSRAGGVATRRNGGDKRVAFRERCGKGSRAGNGVRTGASVDHRPIFFEILRTAATLLSGHGCRPFAKTQERRSKNHTLSLVVIVERSEHDFLNTRTASRASRRLSGRRPMPIFFPLREAPVGHRRRCFLSIQNPHGRCTPTETTL